MSIFEIKEEYFNGSAYDVPTNFSRKYPDDYVFDENLSVKENREMVRRMNEIYYKNREECKQQGWKNKQQFHIDVANYIKEEYGFNEAQAKAIESRLYSEYNDDMSYFFDEVDNFSYWLEEFMILK